MTSENPSWANYGYPVSPQGSQSSNGAGYPIRSHGATSPSNSDNNTYPSPLISPGDWNVPSPLSASSGYHGSVQSYNNSPYESPSSAPQGMDSSVSSMGSSCESPPSLPANLGNRSASSNRPGVRKEVMESITQEFLCKTSLDQGREKAANRRALALIEEATAVQDKRNPHNGTVMTYKVRPATTTAPERREHLATSSWKGAKSKVPDEDIETVDDYKCQLDRDREKWAKNMALKLFKIQGVEGAA